MQQNPANAKVYLSNYFPSDITGKYESDLAGMRKHYEANIELVYVVERKFCIDEDLRSLGIKSNRNVATLKTLIDLLAEPSKVNLALNCLTRYTGQSLKASQAWNQWYEENAQHLIFSDAGGYQFYRVPDPN